MIQFNYTSCVEEVMRVGGENLGHVIFCHFHVKSAFEYGTLMWNK